MKDKIIEILREKSGSFVSGQTISAQLGITRAAVWKYIKKLQGEGYDIESVSKKGYKLTKCPDTLTFEEVKAGLETEIIGQKLVHFNVIDSTNIKAKELAENGEGEGTVVVSESQTSGRGREGRKWFSQDNRGICMSLILKPDIDLVSVPIIAQIGCAAVGKAAMRYTDNVKIKWPNDVFSGSKKICGILTESSGEIDKVNYVILGIGINVNQDKSDFGALAGAATSLKIETGRSVSRKKLFCDVLNGFEKMYFEFKKTGKAEKALGFCRKNSALIGKRVEFKRGEEVLTANVKNLSPHGGLILEHKKGEIEIPAGEIKLI